MSQVPDEELISAYLDGEVSDAERAHVERLLADNPQSRALYDELRALGTSLQGLPRQPLEEDFVDGVISRAERAMLSLPDESVHAQRRLASDGGAEMPRGWSLARLRRPLIWSGLAVAAALVLMFLSPDASRDQQPDVLVQGPRNESIVEGLGAEREESIRALAETAGETLNRGGADPAAARDSSPAVPSKSGPDRRPASGELADAPERGAPMRELDSAPRGDDGEPAGAPLSVLAGLCRSAASDDRPLRHQSGGVSVQGIPKRARRAEYRVGRSGGLRRVGSAARSAHRE